MSGEVAEEGTYKELSNNPDGAFSKLMEWQMSGGEVETKHSRNVPTEEEEIQEELNNETPEQASQNRV